MTTVTAEQRLTIVKHLAAGKDLDWVAAATRFDRSVVLDIASRHGYPDVSKLAWARDVLAEKAQQPAPPPTPAPAAAPQAVTRPAPGGTPQQQQPTVGALIAAGRASGSKRITAQADRVAAGITKLGDMLAAERAKIEARRERERAKVRVMTPAERLRTAAEKIRETTSTEEVLRAGDPYYAVEVMPDGSVVSEQGAYERLWSPPVALAVAKVLDAEATYVEEWAALDVDVADEVEEASFALADLILGAES